jgi:hypothetical protein
MVQCLTKHRQGEHRLNKGQAEHGLVSKNGLYSLLTDSTYLILITQHTNQHTDTANVLTAELLQHKAYQLLGKKSGKQGVNA